MKRPDTLIEVVEALRENEAFWAPAMVRKRMIFVEHEPLSRARMPR